MRPSTGIKAFFVCLFFPVQAQNECVGAAPPTCLQRSDLCSVGHTNCTSEQNASEQDTVSCDSRQICAAGKETENS